MIDSVLKGTGNSRFLKSAVPAGTSWADALAMLQAGTFPIDFNGINTEGFQQVGTPLNKANLLKDATAAQIGLPPSTTPDGMFQALGNTGELHVWRKTVVVGSYYIGSAQGNYGCICRNTGSASFGVKIQYASEITVDGHENRNLVSPADMTIIANNSGITSPSATSVANTLKGKFIRLAGIPDGYQNSELKYAVGSVFYCPESISCFVKDVFSDGNYYICLDGIKNVPTKTENVVTYPVSTNPNAYQEGDDAKAAGYTLGDATNGVVISDMSGTADFEITTGTAVNVSDDGAVALGGSVTTLSSTYKLSKIVSDLKTYGSGKFCSIVCTYNKQYTSGKFLSGIWYIPSDATMSVDTTITGAAVNLSVVGAKPVTGYAAIPAGTTIEYLGKLGDKARVQVVSYVGTGTYGSSNPNSLTFDFVPKMVIIRSEGDSYNKFDWIIGMTDVEVHWDGDYHCFASVDGKKLSFYSLTNSFYQMNNKGQKYYAIAIG